MTRLHCPFCHTPTPISTVWTDLVCVVEGVGSHFSRQPALIIFDDLLQPTVPTTEPVADYHRQVIAHVGRIIEQHRRLSPTVLSSKCMLIIAVIRYLNTIPTYCQANLTPQLHRAIAYEKSLKQRYKAEQGKQLTTAPRPSQHSANR